MIDIPLGKALVPVESDICNECLFWRGDCDKSYLCRCVNCESFDRKDDKNVIFRLVDWPGEENDNE